MNLSLAAIEVEAFKNFVAPTVVPLDYVAPGLHFVQGRNQTNERMGSNGSGKTTLFSDAVTWCLFGKTVGGLRTTDVKSWLTKKSPRVALTFLAGETEHVLQRGPKATDLTLDGREIGQEDVDAFLGLTYPAFAQAVIWGQGQPLFLDLRPQEKMSLLSDALGLERWERRAEAAGARGKRLATSLADLEGELRGLETARDQAKATLEDAEAAAKDWGQNHAKRLEDLGVAAKEARRVAEAAEKELGGHDLADEEGSLKLKHTREAADSAGGEVVGKERELGEIRNRLGIDRHDLKKTEEHLTAFSDRGVCPTCGQEVGKKDAAKHADEITAQVKALQKAIDKNEKAEKALLTEVERLRKVADKFDDEVEKLEAEDNKRRSEVLTWSRRATEAKTMASIATDTLMVAEKETNPHRNTAANAKARLKEINTQLSEADDLAGKTEASIERAQFWAKGFREIRLMVVDELLTDLQETTAAVLEDLGLGEWEVGYATERETQSGTTKRALVATVRAPGAPEGVRWEVYSGGEGQRLRLASALALGEVLLAHAGTRLDFRVLDEPTRGLSREGVRDLTEMLSDYAEDAGIRLFYVDHQSSDGTAFKSSILVTATEAGATVS